MVSDFHMVVPPGCLSTAVTSDFAVTPWRPAVRRRARRLRPQDVVRDLLRHHHGREVGVGARDHGKDRGVHYAQSVHAAHAALVVRDRHRIVVRSHAARTRAMPHADRCALDIGLQRVVVLQRLLEPGRFHDEATDHELAQEGRAVHQRCADPGEDAVLRVVGADLADLVGEARRKASDVTAFIGGSSCSAAIWRNPRVSRCRSR